MGFPGSFLAPLLRAGNFIRRHAVRSGAVFVVTLLVGGFLYSHYFGPTLSYAKTEQFLVEPGASLEDVARELKESGLVRSELIARAVISQQADGKTIRSGAYDIGKQMDLWTISHKLTSMPSLVFVTIPPAVRKEQIGEQLAEELNWGDTQKAEWKTLTEADPSLNEGVYFPDTYLIPSDQSPTAIAARLRARFTDVFAPYAEEAEAKGMDWRDVLTLASIVDREAAANDKELVAGILLNRIDLGMKLQADATLQYAKGKPGKWWAVPKSEDKFIDSAFNTYQHEGLPPHPINNPSVASVEAVLNAQPTGCMFYLHDSNGQIHCSVTYSGHKQNVDRYLR